MTTGLKKGLTSYGDAGFSLFLRKAFIKAAGYSDDALDRPIVGITDTASDYNPCHGNAPQLIEAVRRGVMLAGGLPMRFPTISIHESFAHPTSMYLRNLMAMDTEEMLRAQPMDAVVLVGGCDKTLPAQIMGAAERRHPGHRGAGRPDGGRPPPRRGARRLHRLPPLLGPAPRRQDRRGRDRGDQRPARALGRHLHGDGHGLHHGLHGRGDGPVAAATRPPSPRRTPSACAAARRPARSAVALATKHAPARATSSPRPRSATPWWCCRRSAARPTAWSILPPSPAASARSIDLRGVRPDRARGAGAGRPQALRRPLHGALPPRRRRAAPAVGTRARSSTWTRPTVAGGTLRDYADAAEEVPGQTVIRTRSAPLKPHRRHGGAARQPRPGRRRHQALRRHARAPAGTPAARWCSTASRT